MISQKCAGFWSVSEKLDYFCPVYFVAMKRLIIGALICACAFLIVHAAPQAPATRKPLTIEQLIDIRHPSNAMWSPDGRHVVFVWDRAGVSNVYVSDLTGSAPRELKDAGASLNGAFWTSDGRALMIPKDGDLWRVPIDGSAASAVWTTPQQESRIVASPDRTRVAFVRPNGGRGSELWIRTLSDGRESLVVRADENMMSGVGWSPDAQSLIFTYGGSTIRRGWGPARMKGRAAQRERAGVGPRSQKKKLRRNRSRAAADLADGVGSTRGISSSIARRLISNGARRRSSTSPAVNRRCCTKTSRKNSGA
ncbi:MAG: hypothetical protein AUJ01_15655 [Acidobacteria bacterium 13_1_40CM_3_65_5]|nr:MAG: hypothetical protein AUJ01_15655 [Acidobacteria bacterium 13_1_40CM_3_65_5]